MLALDLPEGDDHKNVARIGNLVHQAARTGLVTQVKVDEQRLRKKSEDILPRLLERLAQEKLRLASEILQT